MSLPAGHKETMLREIYRRLLAAYGPQGWWPTTPRGSRRPRYQGGPRNKRQRLEVVLGAILTQNTAWKNVELALAQLQQANLIDIEGLLALRKDALARLIKSSGYFNQKAIKLKEVARFLQLQPLRQLGQMELAEARRLLLAVKGIGPETADSILLYALDKPIFVIDAYTRRIFSRLGLCGPQATYAELQELCHRELKPNTALYNEFHALLVAHGKDVCRRQPRCAQCVLSAVCPKLI